VWSTAPPEKEEKHYAERIAEILKRDPEDVAPLRTKPLPRDPLHSLTPHDGGDIATPRWTRDGKSILYAHRQSDREGFFHYDLFRWTPDNDEVERLTQLADVRDADPYPGGAGAIAVRSRYGFSQLVRVSFDGTVTEITPPSLDTIYANPRISPDGKRIAYIANHEGKWQLTIDETVLPASDVTSFEWINDTELVATISARPFAELHRITLDGNTTPLTRSTGGAFDPAPSPDGRIFFMAIEPDGYVVRVIDKPSPVGERGVQRAPLGEGDKFLEHPLPPSTSYNLGHQEFAWFFGTTHAPGQHTAELGVRLGDVVGRLDTLLIGSDDGAALLTAWRGWPIELAAHAFTSHDDNGLEVRGSWTQRSTLRRLDLEAGALAGDTSLGFAETTLRLLQLRGAWRIDEALHASAEFGDTSHERVVARGSIAAGAFRVSARYQHDRGDAVTLGGLPSSLLPRSSFASTVLDPALPVATLRGDRYDGARIELVLPGIPVTAFYQQHRLSSRLTLAGIELAFHSDPMPIVKLPGLDFTAGAARVFDDPLRDRTKWWLGMRWTP
ncbi:MAG TPA: hypothetical protein VN181_02950, partial [Thermoanaerobaculia bacterium]|nr:hypothetical protein [Thermoanaerobaculia bacterium]